MKKLSVIAALLTCLAISTTSLAGTFGPVTVTDQTPSAPLASPVPSSYQPRYISGFGQDDAFTVFFEDRDAGGTISYVSTTTGPTGFPAAPTATNIADTHFCVKDWSINIGGTDYAYRAWASVGNNPQHHFYVSNDLTNWTLISTFTIPNAASFTDAHGWVYYGFHDVILLNGTYYAFAESNQSQTMLVSSANGDDVWEAFASIGGRPGWGPLELPTGVSYGWTPSGSFFELPDDAGYGKIHVDPRDSNFYLAVNSAAKPSLAPADLEAAFINPANWTWHDGTTGPAANPILSQTAEHDLRECWQVPSSDPSAGWVIIYDADYGSGDGGKALGYAALTPPTPPDSEGPVTTAVLATPNPVSVGGTVTLSANVDDTDTGGSSIASAEYSVGAAPWTAMAAQDGAFDEVNEVVSASLPDSLEAGVYSICVRGTDSKCNLGSAECVLLAVYDPAAGFVTGSGWIDSPVNTDYQYMQVGGKASFGFVAKYKKGANIPEGNTEFQFKAGNLNFHSTAYDWLVVNQGGTRAQFKGSGTINGSGDYRFMLWAGDGEPDTFRIKIWYEDGGEEVVVYDNGTDQAIGGGSIVVHTK